MNKIYIQILIDPKNISLNYIDVCITITINKLTSKTDSTGEIFMYMHLWLFGSGGDFRKHWLVANKKK